MPPAPDPQPISRADLMVPLIRRTVRVYFDVRFHGFSDIGTHVLVLLRLHSVVNTDWWRRKLVERASSDCR